MKQTNKRIYLFIFYYKTQQNNGCHINISIPAPPGHHECPKMIGEVCGAHAVSISTSERD
jgi:hypothetical protein